MRLFLDLLVILVILLSIVGVLTWFGKRRSKKLSVKGKNGWLIAHIISVIIYFSGMFGTLLLALSTTFITDEDLIYAAHLFIQFFDWFLIIPGAFTSLITGVWLAVRTHWGMTKHYWVMAKWIGNIVAITFGGNFMRMWIHDNFKPIFSSSLHPLQNPLYLENREMLFIGTAISFSILLFLAIISYLKPWGKRKDQKKTKLQS
ncbi:MAG: DUF2269 domain-containing protein [Bacillota bacterium]